MIKNQRGQMTIEMILIAIILTGIGLSLLKKARDAGWATAITEKPWLYIQGVIEDGVWQPAPASKKYSPHLLVRHAAPRGDDL